MLHIKFSKQNKSVCEERGNHLSMDSMERIEPSIDPNTWIPLDEDTISKDVLSFCDEESYENRFLGLKRKQGYLRLFKQVSDIQMEHLLHLVLWTSNLWGGSMGSVVGEKITCLIEYATQKLLPLVLVCASGGARMQEGTVSLMQMAKISSALHYYQVQKKLLYISILTYPTTGGITASFGMLGDIIIAESKAYIAFAGKRVIEETLGQKVPDGFQLAEALFENGLLDLIVPRILIKGVLSKISDLYSSVPYKKN
ncbi:hypothetical protein KP509_02G014300 [Ceratopteris richardii]|uniref:CoA carboxyltransferase N-terminal domain-containing protein n=1 Tax=Ceratopteris richardii TaxID=49495 RepID=A0A8T2V6L9_CERRI|nr:hypothetical protein KP509_02G014300 [Ceratopteris richardii]